MIDPTDMQAYLEKLEGGVAGVDLLPIGKTRFEQELKTVLAHHGGRVINKHSPAKMRLAIDMEDCLDRFYGGYYSDWACGGQWNRAYQFVQLLVTAFSAAHIEIIVFFDGTLREHKNLLTKRNETRQKTISVLKHIRMIATPPPKIWWLPPCGLRSCLRSAMRSLNIQVVQTVFDHSMEVIEYYNEHKLDGILGLQPEFIVANVCRYFSSHDLRLTYRGSLETKEFIVSKLLTSLSLTTDHLPFIAVLLGGYVRFDEATLKRIYFQLNIDGGADFEARIKRIAEIVRNSPTNDLSEFIKHLKLEEFGPVIRESVEYYQRRGKFCSRKYFGTKKRYPETSKVKVAPSALETGDNDEMAKKLLSDANNLVEESVLNVQPLKSQTTAKNGSQSNFVYTLSGEVLKTALDRHQRGVMDPKIYQLLTKKTIILPQILEDEQYREIPSIHLFYRPARQMIYALLFNLYHQKYLCSKANQRSGSGGVGLLKPDVTVTEWIWSPQNEYKKPDIVHATPLQWAVPTIQRLWFGTAFEDKQRRMKAFLTIMRSDSSLMLNRGYVPQHMLVLACVLRYIVRNTDRHVLTRHELDAFLATAFSQQLINVEYTQELVLPGVHLRGIYLATLFMQGVETASLANDACGVPLPWLMTNPWLFFDGKLFHLKLKMSSYVSNLRELCDDQIEIVLKIERFRKAILEDFENYVVPTNIDPLYRPGCIQSTQANSHPAYTKNMHSTMAQQSNISQSMTNGDLSNYYQQAQSLPQYYGTGNRNQLRSSQQTGRVGTVGSNQNRILNVNDRTTRTLNGGRGYQLKVGGVVVGSWAGGAPSRPLHGARGNRSLMVRYPVARSRFPPAVRMQHMPIMRTGMIHHQQATQSHFNMRAAHRSAFGTNKLPNRNRPRRPKRERRWNNTTPNRKSNDKNTIVEDVEEEQSSENTGPSKEEETDRSVKTKNGTTGLDLALVNSICDKILKDDDPLVQFADEGDTNAIQTTENDTARKSCVEPVSANKKSVVKIEKIANADVKSSVEPLEEPEPSDVSVKG